MVVWSENRSLQQLITAIWAELRLRPRGYHFSRLREVAFPDVHQPALWINECRAQIVIDHPSAVALNEAEKLAGVSYLVPTEHWRNDTEISFLMNKW